jgi:hypothetical protein
VSGSSPLDLVDFIGQIAGHNGAVVTAVRHEGNDFLVDVEFDTSQLTSRRVQLACHDVVAAKLSPGWIEEFGYHSQHPLLMVHGGPQSQLFFSSAPERPGDVFLVAHATIAELLGDWVEPRELLVHAPQHFAARLAQGHGLLARGPRSVVEELERRLAGLLQVNSVASHAIDKHRVAMTFDDGYAVCVAITATAPP